MPVTDENREDRLMLESLVDEAAQIALSYFGNDPEVWWKEGDSPVSRADYAVNEFLQEKLLRERPDYGWLSEETDEKDQLIDNKRTFVVDPIDGTRGFINGMKRWCVSVAIVEDNRPVVGVLSAPVIETTISAASGEGTRVNEELCACCVPEEAGRIRMTGPKTFLASEDQSYARIDKFPFVPSLAWRLAMVARGELHVALARGSAKDWDLAAADLIVEEAGGRLSDLNGAQLKYNCDEERSQGLLACAEPAHPELLKFVGQALAK